MFIIRLSVLPATMAASVSGCSFDLDVPWPLHRALVELADREPPPGGWPWSFEIGLVDHAGLGVPALGAAVLEATRDGYLQPDADRPRRLVASPAGAVAARRLMMTLDPAAVAAVYRAALIWATASSTVSKNFETAAWSATPTSATRPPKRRQPVPVPTR